MALEFVFTESLPDVSRLLLWKCLAKLFLSIAEEKKIIKLRNKKPFLILLDFVGHEFRQYGESNCSVQLHDIWGVSW